MFVVVVGLCLVMFWCGLLLCYLHVDFVLYCNATCCMYLLGCVVWIVVFTCLVDCVVLIVVCVQILWVLGKPSSRVVNLLLGSLLFVCACVCVIVFYVLREICISNC